MRASPDVVEVFLAALALLLELFVDFYCLSSSIQDLAGGRRPGHVLVRYTCHLVSRTLDATVITWLQISGVALDVRFCPYCGHASWSGVEASKWLQWVDYASEIVLGVSGVGSWVCKGHRIGVVGFRCGCFSRLCCTWSLLASSVFFCEALLSGFAFPVIVPHSASVDNQSASKLAEHGAGSHDGNLS